ncbi:3-oxoacyl-[acyl-carrier-protein] reductase FabG [compost metagenome]|jgi:short-subunit dehydrogenase|uniref:SDR family oxidoreductase n=1 Tax=Pseudomonas TaxID=286 RepID=UPI000F9EAA44|nr:MULTISPECIES: SDR family NAD(P)-dependent oxidoreductase [unclassified Pseudomonas]MDD2063993.1 SDR family NAD(P)-dependent oxidoreductase [Pseudomonas sp. 25571]MDD2130401.1 SDR family NAD(P)-dependent oxidoreductase [Pseudomonas sp. 17391]UDU80550.1 SDR family NAD(P)-dependent oxidoreductase [Pseudomonas sp. HN2-3]UPL06814.1 3-oxoacyl-[acyl-carrier-protein] reductase FabG [Pseudomonas sp. IsoF]
MRVLVVGASKGLGKAFMEGLGKPGDTLIGVARSRPERVVASKDVEVQWIAADLAQPAAAVEAIAQALAGGGVDTLIYNLGLWEAEAFAEHYSFLADRDAELQGMVDCNITATILLIKRLLPMLLESEKPRILLTGSTSGLPQSGRPEVTFAASKFALRGIAEALREGYREQGLGVTCLNLGYLNTEDGLDVPVAEAAARGEGGLIPLHDVVLVVRTMLELSAASYVRELTLPAIADERF